MLALWPPFRGPGPIVGFHLLTSSKPHHLPKAPPPNAIAMEVGDS